MCIIKVLHIISGGDNGGAKSYLLNLCKAGNKLFDNVIGCINEGPVYDDANRLGIESVIFTQKSRFDLRITSEILQYVSKNNIDIINFHGANANFIHMFMKNKTGTPCVTTLHSDYRYDFINSRVKHLIFTPLNALALMSFNQYICVSSKIKGSMKAEGFKGKKYVINCGADTDVTISVPRENIRRKYNVDNNDFVYTMVARFHPVKNHVGLLKAFKKLKDNFEDVKILFVGDGDNMSVVKNEVESLGLQKDVIFAGRQNEPENFMNAGDINILPSFSEGFPLVLIEGAAVGRSIICTKNADIEEIVNENTGFVINPESVDDMYEKMKEAYSSRERLKVLEGNIKALVLKRCSLEVFGNKYSQVYSEIMKGDLLG